MVTVSVSDLPEAEAALLQNKLEVLNIMDQEVGLYVVLVPLILVPLVLVCWFLYRWFLYR